MNKPYSDYLVADIKAHTWNTGHRTFFETERAPCDMCGRDSSDLQVGVCTPCRNRYQNKQLLLGNQR